MNRTHLLSLAIVLAAAGNALADDITIEPHPFVSTATRAEVQEDLRQFRLAVAGSGPWADEYIPLGALHSGRTRAEVTAEYMASRETVAAFTAEDSGSAYLARATVPMDRGLVVAHTE